MAVCARCKEPLGDDCYFCSFCGEQFRPAPPLDIRIIAERWKISLICSEGVVIDLKTKLMWQREASERMYGTSVLNYARQLTYAGFSDWRVPSPEEMMTLVVSNGQEYPFKGPGERGLYWEPEVWIYDGGNGAFWTSTEGICMFFHIGNYSPLERGELRQVRCVRTLVQGEILLADEK